MVILDTAIVVVALPSIQTDLGFSPSDLQWVLSAYALTFGGLLLLGGRAADLLGRRRVFMVGLAFFTLASLLCGLAWSPAALIIARGIQGIGAAIMTPTALSILTTTFEEGAERNKALGIWGSLGGVGGTAGWLIGGPLTDLSWEWIFFLNVPIGAVALLLAPRLLRESRGSAARRGVRPAGRADRHRGARPARLRARRCARGRVGRRPDRRTARRLGGAVRPLRARSRPGPRRRCSRSASWHRARWWAPTS